MKNHREMRTKLMQKLGNGEKSFKNNPFCGQVQWLTPIIPTTWEAEIRRVVILRSAQAKA
jgi:hypothetical protein